MDERTIFLNALDEEDPERRRAYLDFACAGKPALRERLETLLRGHQEVGTFLAVPALEQIVQDDQRLAFLAPATQPGSLGRLDHYEVLEVVGQGRMGIVLKGRDTKLLRLVAIKVLKSLLAVSDPWSRRSWVNFTLPSSSGSSSANACPRPCRARHLAGMTMFHQ
jgi:hypothetical protein